MLLVIGETLVDLVVARDGSIEAALGGAPSNTAVAAARLGLDVGFVGSISTDPFGGQLLERLVVDGVNVAQVSATELPTSLALADLDESGAATYRFYFAETSVPQLTGVDLGNASAVFTGGLALVLEPMAAAVERAVAMAEVPVVVDVNCRPAVVADRSSYLERVDRVVSNAALVKVSDDDLDVLTPGQPVADAAAALLDRGAGAVIVTRGSAPTSVITDAGSVEVPIPGLAPGAAVVDTIGAGDTFIAGVLAGLIEPGWLAPGRTPTLEELVDAVRLGQRAAAIVVTRRGADPPTRAELGSAT